MTNPAPAEPVESATARWWIRVGYIVSVAVLLLGPWVMQQQRFLLTTDSFSYLNAAWHIQRGDGLVLSQVDPLRTESPDAVYLRPLTQWPPLYPLLCAIPMAMGMPLDLAGWLVAYLTTAGALFLAWRLVLRHVPHWWALPTALLLATAPALTPLATLAWSEGTALLCMVGMYYLLDVGLARRRDDPQAPLPIIGLGLLTVAGFLARYAFLFTVPGVLVGLFLATRGRSAERLRLFGLYAGICLAGIGPWLLRNALLVGHLEGKAPRPGQVPFHLHLADIMYRLFGRELPGIGWLAGALLIFMLLLVIQRALPLLREQGRTLRVLILPVSAGIQILCLALAESQRQFDPVDFRFLAPITLLLLMTGIILAAVFLERGVKSLPYRALIWVLPIPALALTFPGIHPQMQVFAVWLLIVIAEVVAKVGPNWRERAVGWLVLVSMLGFHTQAALDPRPLSRQARHGDIAAWMRANMPPGSVYAGSRAARDLLLEAPEYLQLIGVSATVGYPEMWLDDEGLRDLQRRYGLRYLIFPGPPSPLGAEPHGPTLQYLMTAADLPPDVGFITARAGFRVVELAPLAPESSQ